MTTRKLTCHCGAVELEITSLDNFNDIYRCDCSFCASRGAIMTAVPLKSVRIVQGSDNLTLYQWGTNTAKHYFCKTCGIYTHHQRKVSPNEFGLNVAALTGLNPRELGNIPWPEISHR